MKIEDREHLNAWIASDKLLVLRDASIVLCIISRKENDDRMQIGARKASDPMCGAFTPVSPSISARAAMPCLNSSGNEASEASSNPIARSPFHVKAAVTQRLSSSIPARIDAAEWILSLIADTHARPLAPSRNERNSYRAVSAGARVSSRC